MIRVEKQRRRIKWRAKLDAGLAIACVTARLLCQGPEIKNQMPGKERRVQRSQRGAQQKVNVLRYQVKNAARMRAGTWTT